MSVPGVGSNAAAKIHEHAVTDKEAETYADDDALELERNIKSDEEDKEADDGANDEQDNLEKGTFQPHAHPHIGWGEHNTSPPAHEPTHDGKANGDAKTIHPYGRGGAARRPSGSVADLTAEAAELARAEAASWAQMCPLMAATLGPLSVLLGIPTLTQRWRGQLLDPPVLSSGISNVVELPDPTLSIVLAGVALFCEVAGNGLLILRFSNFHTRITTWVSYAFWIAKIALGIANYIQFALNYPQTQDIIYLEGFWVGVCSMAVTIIIIVFLTFNLAFLHRQSDEETARLHRVQREFMMQTLTFFLYTGITALIVCKVEGLTYVNGIYYIVVTTLTIGFGDITPNTAVIKVLTFPFTIIGITLLALIVTSIVRLLSDRARRRKIALKKRLKARAAEKKKIHAGYGSRLRPWSRRIHGGGDELKLKRSMTLQEELVKLRQDDWKRERRANLRSMATGFSVFLVFWFIGALIFHFVEPWGYGDALYFCYIFFLTIGFGDFSPASEAGRPVFIVYALLAVPTMTIIVETVTTNFTSFTMQRVNKRQRLYKDKDFQVQSLTSLVKIAKERTIEKMENPNNVNVKLPLQDLTERLTESLEQMHHNLQSLLMQKLGPDARNIIAAERARQTRAKTERLEAREPNDKMKEDNVAKTLAEVGSEGGDELEMLNAYRERYAGMLADLAIARDSLVTMETTLQDEGVGGLAVQKRVSEDMDKLGRPRRRSKSSDLSLTSDDEMAKGRRRKGRRRGSRDTEVDDRGKRRRRSSGISSDLSVSSEEEPGKGKNRRRSTGQSSGEKHGTMEPIGVIRRVWK